MMYVLVCSRGCSEKNKTSALYTDYQTATTVTVHHGRAVALAGEPWWESAPVSADSMWASAGFALLEQIDEDLSHGLHDEPWLAVGTPLRPRVLERAEGEVPACAVVPLSPWLNREVPLRFDAFRRAGAVQHGPGRAGEH